jgi:hypothetical protein
MEQRRQHWQRPAGGRKQQRREKRLAGVEVDFAFSPFHQSFWSLLGEAICLELRSIY